MINKLFFLINNLLFNNWILFTFYNYKLKEIDYSFNFFNINFENKDELKKIIFSKEYLEKKIYDEKSINYHNFDWLNTAKNIGGSEIVTLCKKHIINWYYQKYSIFSFVWDSTLIAKRLINLIYNFDFYAVSATEKEKIIIKSIIVKHYLTLKLQLLTNKYYLYSIEISKAILLFNLINKLETKKIIDSLNQQIHKQINENGMHKSINPCVHAEYINHLYEIKNMFLYFDINDQKKIELQIVNMISVLKNLYHKDNTIALFNGSNNSNLNEIKKINKLQKDLKTKNLSNIKNGLAIYENSRFKIFLDVTKPTNKLLSQNLHSGTLSFEISCDKEKIITNCGSIEKRIGKKPEFLRYSAAHSTIIINNTNISELIEKKSYKRAPKKIIFKNEENVSFLLWEATHDGYEKNYKKIIKRKLLISKKNPKVLGEDSIISTKFNSNKILYNIRFHLSPICACLLTNNKKSVLIKTKLNHSWVFKSDSKLTIEESIYINDGKRISKTRQIVISGYASKSKQTEKWSLTKLK